MKKLYFIITIFSLYLFSAVISIAAVPQINSVAGTITNGQTLTIGGSSLVDENNSNWWTFFKTAGVSGFEGASLAGDGYNPQTSGSGSSYGYDTSMYLDGGKSAYFQITGAHSGAENPRSSIWINSGGGTDIYMRVYARWTGTGWPGNWYKFIWNSNYNGFQPDQGSSPPTRWRMEYLGDGHYFNIASGQLQRNRWYCIELRYKLSSPQRFTAWVDGVLLNDATGMSDLGIQYPELGIINLDGTNSSFVGRVNVDGYVYGNSRIYPKAVIEIGDSSNYSTAKKVYQYPQYLSDGSLQIECNLTGLGGGPYYLWITNNRQERSAAYLLQSGQVQSDTQPPTNPTNLAAAVVSSSQINLSWTASTDNVGIAGYRVYRNGTQIGTSANNSYQNTGLSAATTYSYTVAAYDAAGNISAQSSSASATTSAAIPVPADTQAPSTPSNLTASTASSSQINLSWTASTDNVGVAGYRVYRNGTQIGTSANNSYQNTGLSAATTYSYTVAAYDAAGNVSAQSRSASTTTATSTSGNTGQSSSATTLLQEKFEDTNFSARGWYDNTSHGSIVSAGYSGNCLQWAWTAGQTKPTNGSAMRQKFTIPSDQVYVKFYQKFQSTWRGSQKTYHPHMIMILSDYDGDWQSPYFAYLNTYIEALSDIGSPYTIRPGLRIQDNVRINADYGNPPNNLTATTENRDVGGCNGTKGDAGTNADCYYDGEDWLNMRYFTVTSSSITKNAWVKVEVWFKMNTVSGGVSNADGEMKMWLDDVQVLNKTNVVYRTAQDSTKKWNQIVLAPYIGDGAPITQTMWIDELTVATGRDSDDTALAAPTNLRIQ